MKTIDSPWSKRACRKARAATRSEAGPGRHGTGRTRCQIVQVGQGRLVNADVVHGSRVAARRLQREFGQAVAIVVSPFGDEDMRSSCTPAPSSAPSATEVQSRRAAPEQPGSAAWQKPPATLAEAWYQPSVSAASSRSADLVTLAEAKKSPTACGTACSGRPWPRWVVGQLEAHAAAIAGAAQHGLSRDLRLDQRRQLHQRFLPAQVAHLQRNDLRDAGLRDAQLGAAQHRLQCDRHLQQAGQVGVVEAVGVAESWSGTSLQVLAAEGMAVAAAEVVERHAEAAADARVHLLHLAGEAVRRQPLDHGVGFEKGAIHLLRRAAQHAVQTDGAVGHGVLLAVGGGGHIPHLNDDDSASGVSTAAARHPGAAWHTTHSLLPSVSRK